MPKSEHAAADRAQSRILRLRSGLLDGVFRWKRTKSRYIESFTPLQAPPAVDPFTPPPATPGAKRLSFLAPVFLFCTPHILIILEVAGSSARATRRWSFSASMRPAGVVLVEVEMRMRCSSETGSIRSETNKHFPSAPAAKLGLSSVARVGSVLVQSGARNAVGVCGDIVGNISPIDEVVGAVAIRRAVRMGLAETCVVSRSKFAVFHLSTSDVADDLGPLGSTHPDRMHKPQQTQLPEG